jgi:hypothetical protein
MPVFDPDAPAVDLTKIQDGKGCGTCHYLGWGPGLCVRCTHPERACWITLSFWALGCPQREPFDKQYQEGAPKPYLEPVDLGAWCEEMHQRRLAQRRRGAEKGEECLP